MSLPSDSNSDPKVENLSFEEAYRRLGEMVNSLESGGLPLTEATALYEKGMKLVRRCNQLLNETELKITQLSGATAEPEPPDILEWEDDPEE